MVSGADLSISFVPYRPVLIELQVLQSASLSVVPSARSARLYSVTGVTRGATMRAPLLGFETRLNLTPSRVVPIELTVVFYATGIVYSWIPPVGWIVPRLRPITTAARPRDTSEHPGLYLVWVTIE